MRIGALTIVAAGVLLGCSRGPVTVINDALKAPIEEITTDAAYDELPKIEVAPGDWPWWRGPNADGKALSATVPATWGPDENIIWSTEVPGDGHSSPVTWGKRIFLTSADMDQELQQLLCLNRENGDMLWSLTVHQGGFMRMHKKNSQASATPACDGEHVFVAFINSDGLYVTAVNLEGKQLWQTNSGEFSSEHGYGSSPALYGSLVIVNGDNPGGGFLAALHRKTGEIVWRTARKKGGSYGTPVVANVAGKTQLLLSGRTSVDSYDPETGKLIWTCNGPADVIANTVGFDDNHVYASGGYPQKEILCIRADGTGDVSDTHVAWRAARGVSYEPSPLVHDGLVYFASSGIVTCFDVATGEEVWKKRIGGGVSSSFVLVGDKLLIGDESGVTTVFQPGREGKVLAKNDLKERIMASPAVDGDNRLLLRTQHHLYCIGAGKSGTGE